MFLVARKAHSLPTSQYSPLKLRSQYSVPTPNMWAIRSELPPAQFIRNRVRTGWPPVLGTTSSRSPVLLIAARSKLVRNLTPSPSASARSDLVNARYSTAVSVFDQIAPYP